MKKILSVFKRDIRAIIKNPIAIIIVLGICVIPSLYAWVNIKAGWDPYSNTGTIPIAIVNNDKGANLNEKELNMGNDIVDKLKDNDKIGWKFVNQKQADTGVVDGTYYAVIEIPEDFSKNLISLTTDEPKKPEIIYKVDTKANPVSVKIAGAAEDSLVKEVKTNFISTVNATVFNSIGDASNKVEKNKDDIIKMKNVIITLNDHMDAVLNILGDVSQNSENLNTYLLGIKETLPSLTKSLEDMQNNTDNAKDLASYTKNSLNNSVSNLDTNISNLKASSDRINVSIINLMDDVNAGINSSTSSSLNTIRQNAQTMKKSVEAIETYLKAINDKVHNQSLDNLIKSLEEVNTIIDSELANVDDVQNAINNKNSNINSELQELLDRSNDASNGVNNTSNSYNSSVKPELNNIFDKFINLTNDANKILEGSKNGVNQVNTIISSAEEGTALTTETANHLKLTLEKFKGDINELSEKLKEVDDDDLTKILSIIQSDPDLMGANVATPFDVKDESIYKIPNYGTGMTPIYSVLAIWVGGFVLVSALKTTVPEFEGSKDLKPRDIYLGKLMLFLVIGVVQSLIIVLGDKYLLGVQVVSMPLFIAFSIVIALCFNIIIYTLVSLLGNLGKAISIVIMVLQIAGSGGTYPIQLDPVFFRIVQPFFPFTYALGGFREAIAGPLVSSVVMNFAMLILFGGIFLVVGILFKEKLHKKVSRFEEKFEESGIAE